MSMKRKTDQPKQIEGAWAAVWLLVAFILVLIGASNLI